MWYFGATMGAVKSRLNSVRCGCCGRGHADSYDLKELPRPPRLDASNGRSRSLLPVVIPVLLVAQNTSSR